MRRALLVAAIAAPVTALAQVTAGPGVVLEPNNFDVDVTSSYISAAHCATTNPAPLRIEWQIVALNASETFAQNDIYEIYASDTAPKPLSTGGTDQFCDEKPSTGTPTINAGLVGDTKAERALQTLDIVAAEVVAAAGFACDVSDERETVNVCAHWTNGADGKKGWAWGKFLIQVRAPNRPATVTARAGDGALNITWPDATTGTAAEARSYLVVVMRGPVEVRREEVDGLSLRVDGLENEVTYDVQVFGLSPAKNLSLEAATTRGTPTAIDDFWERYRDAGGREQGGCGSGAGGPVALLAVGGLLALLRRRK